MIALLQEEGREGFLRQWAACMQQSKLALLTIEMSWKQMRMGARMYICIG